MIFLGYLDPGTGSIIFQSVVGVVAGIGVFGRKAIRQLAYKIKSPGSGSNTEAQNSDKARTKVPTKAGKNL